MQENIFECMLMNLPFRIATEFFSKFFPENLKCIIFLQKWRFIALIVNHTVNHKKQKPVSA